MKNKEKGFLAVEMLLATGILSILVMAIVGVVLFGEEGTVLAGARNRATLLADEGLEAVRNMRDSSFSNMANGPHGLTVSDNQWAFSGTSDTTDIFTRQIVIADSTVSASFKLVTATITWQQNLQRAGSVSLVTEMTNWRSTGVSPDSCSNYCVDLGIYSSGICRQSAAQCTKNGETYVSGGDIFCIAGGNPKCCCL